MKTYEATKSQTRDKPTFSSQVMCFSGYSKVWKVRKLEIILSNSDLIKVNKTGHWRNMIG